MGIAVAVQIRVPKIATVLARKTLHTSGENPITADEKIMKLKIKLNSTDNKVDLKVIQVTQHFFYPLTITIKKYINFVLEKKRIITKQI